MHKKQTEPVLFKKTKNCHIEQKRRENNENLQANKRKCGPCVNLCNDLLDCKRRIYYFCNVMTNNGIINPQT